ncbi:LysR family transcriptional regulator [Actinomadura sp. KC216]|uniref:LysR family transcriptional regulator n=1 Tax=Actinomadura sp. KC216 TaxID=2530370 RepID=UPI0010434B51|nr:LysR family transcriptional regulator [Actinomadura sp. KC216]TDB87921.1 LysR family transcriptional regulator [Actinomadura sp. KC216]
MNLDHLASYLAVLRTGSFHAAARERGLSQASVSLHVRALENRYGTALIVRDRSGCRPVPGTDEFVHYAGLLLDLADRAGRALARPQLVVGASSNIGTYLIQPIFKSFAAEHAGFETRLVIGANAAMPDRLAAGGIDIALMEWWDHRPGFQAERWRTEEVVVIVGADHPWRSRSAVAVGELAGQPILGGEPRTGTGTLLRERLGPAAEDLRVAMDLGSTEAVKQAVRHGLGISLVLAGAVRDEVRAGVLHALRIEGTPLHKPLWSVIRRDEPPSSPGRRFAERLATG